MIDDDRPGSHERENEFWGTTPDWTNDVERPRRTRRSDSSGDITGAIKNLWGTAVTGGASATRSHGVLDATAPRPVDDHDAYDARDAYDRTAASDRVQFNDLYLEIDRGETTEVPVVDARRERPRAVASSVDRPVSSRRIDPLIARIGAVAVVTTLLVPLAFALDSGDSADTLSSAEVAPPAATTRESPLTEAPAASSAPVPTDPVYLDPSELPPAIPANSGTAAEPAVAVDSSATTVAVSTGGTDAEIASDAAVAATDSVEVKASTTENTDTTEATVAEVAADPVCAVDYIVQSGDYWIGIADGAGVRLAELLTTDGADVSTPLYPGADICLPAGATTPPATVAPATTSATTPATTAPPNTTAAPTTAEPSTTAAPTTVAPTTAAPTTDAPDTTPDTTIAEPIPSPLGSEEVQQIIRDVWPDELEDRALLIAFRESRYVPTARNFCCLGLFQIYWEVHDSWLSGIGITSADQLFDPETNARAAYALYQRAGGWGPWSQTDY